MRKETNAEEEISERAHNVGWVYVLENTTRHGGSSHGVIGQLR